MRILEFNQQQHYQNQTLLNIYYLHICSAQRLIKIQNRIIVPLFQKMHYITKHGLCVNYLWLFSLLVIRIDGWNIRDSHEFILIEFIESG